MTGLIIKVIIFPLTLITSDYLLKDIYYPYIYQPIFIGVVLAVVGHLVEVAILRPGTLLISTIADFLTAFVVIYFSHFIMTGVRVTIIGGIIASTLLALIEYLDHFYLIRSGKTKKSE